MESKTSYTIVGLSVILLLAGLIIACLWLSIGFDKRSYNYYLVYMDESVAGLNEESLVKYNGVKVGMVSKIELSQFDPQKVKILIQIEDGTPITTSTRATLFTQGITGNTYLGLSSSSNSVIPLQKTTEEPYPIIPSKPSFMRHLERSIDSLSRGLERVFTKENEKNLGAILAHLESLTQVIHNNDANINQTFKRLPQLLQELQISIVEFKRMSKDIAHAGRDVTSTMEAGKASINKISQQALPPTVLLLRRLDSIAANLESVSNQMRQNPSVVIRGTTPPTPGPGE